MQSVLSIENLNVHYGSIHAIKGISLEVKKGQIATLIGANGAGKTTTLNAITNLVKKVVERFFLRVKISQIYLLMKL